MGSAEGAFGRTSARLRERPSLFSEVPSRDHSGMDVWQLAIPLGVAVPTLLRFRAQLRTLLATPGGGSSTDLARCRRRLVLSGLTGWVRNTGLGSLAGGLLAGLVAGPGGFVVGMLMVAGLSVGLALPAVLVGGAATYLAAAGHKTIEEAVVIRGRIAAPEAGQVSALPSGSDGELSLRPVPPPKA